MIIYKLMNPVRAHAKNGEMNPVRPHQSYFTFTTSHLALIFHWSFIRLTATADIKCKMIDIKLMKIVNCKLKIASKGGLG